MHDSHTVQTLCEEDNEKPSEEILFHLKICSPAKLETWYATQQQLEASYFFS